ncbi:hypothetical protein K458DRAFT_282360 [Neofusicoccum parvum]|nr:hypothetical protein K458DRAFT_282360 [Neofusicoccum parvum]
MTSTKGTSDDGAAQTDNFYSPENADFYARNLYAQLNPSQKAIRLIKVLQDDGSGQLRCELTNEIPLAEAKGTYSAISYCAGDPQNTRPILVNGAVFNVFANLALALVETRFYRRSKHDDEEPLLWMDQVCINQSDLSERSHQVGFMKEIYRCSREVVICLSTEKVRGHAIDWIHHVLQKMPELESGLDEERASDSSPSAEANKTETLDEKKAGEQTSDEAPSDMWSSINGLSEDNRKKFALWIKLRNLLWSNIHNDKFVRGWLDIFTMLGQPWWTRAWVFQEFMVCESAQFIFGRRAISWRQFAAVILKYIEIDSITTDRDKFLEYYWEEYSLNGPEDCQIYRLEKRRESVKDSMTAVKFILEHKNSCSGHEDLKSLLTHSRFCGASDSRDHVYAFLGLADPAYGITPDYKHKTAQDVFMELARQMILFDNNLSILSHAPAARGDLSPSMPSWVPDWTSKEPSDLRDSSEDLSRRGLFDASRGSDANATFLDGGRILEVTGTFVDVLSIKHIDELGTPLQRKLFSSFDTSRGYLVMTNAATMWNDEVWILNGAKCPFVLRRKGPCFSIVSEADVIGMPNQELPKVMNGDYISCKDQASARQKIRIR